MGIWSNGNPSLQKVLLLYKGVGSILQILKIYLCLSLD